MAQERLYRELSSIIAQQDEHEFGAQLVQMFNMILLTADELRPLRTMLKEAQCSPLPHCSLPMAHMSKR